MIHKINTDDTTFLYSANVIQNELLWIIAKFNYYTGSNTNILIRFVLH